MESSGLAGVYLLGVGTLSFLGVIAAELKGSARTDLPKSGLFALFFLVIGACAASIGEGDGDILRTLREFATLANLQSLQGSGLLVIFALIAYLAVSLNPGQSDLPVRVVCVAGAVCAAMFLLSLVVYTVEAPSLSEQGTALYAVAFLASVATTGWLASAVSMLAAGGPLNRVGRASVLAAALLQSIAFLGFALSFVVRLSQGSAVFPSELVCWAVGAAWTIFVLFGLVASPLLALIYGRAAGLLGQKDAKARSEAGPMVGLLGCSLVAGLALQAITQLSVAWSV